MDKAREQAESKNKWEQIIKECQASPLTIVGFARHHNIGEGSLHNWSKRLGIPLKNKPSADIGFIELKTVPPEAMGERVAYPVEIRTHDLIIKTKVPWILVVELMKEFA